MSYLATETHELPTSASGGDLSIGEVRNFHAARSLRVDVAHYQYQQVTGEAGWLQAVQEYRGLNSLAAAGRICTTVGGKHGVSLALELVAQKTTKIILPVPGWAPYRMIAKSLGLEIVSYDPTKPAMLLEKMRTHLQAAVLLNYPNNPTGIELTQSEFRDVKAIQSERTGWLISDEVYAALARNHVSFDGCALSMENVVVVDSLSKSHAAAGLRLGYVVASRTAIKALESRISLSVSGTSSLSQQLGSELLRDEILAVSLASYVRSLNRSFSQILTANGIEVVSSGGLYVWARCSATLILWGLAVRGLDGVLFGSPGHARFCPASNSVLIEALQSNSPNPGRSHD